MHGVSRLYVRVVRLFEIVWRPERVRANEKKSIKFSFCRYKFLPSGCPPRFAYTFFAYDFLMMKSKIRNEQFFPYEKLIDFEKKAIYEHPRAMMISTHVKIPSNLSLQDVPECDQNCAHKAARDVCKQTTSKKHVATRWASKLINWIEDVFFICLKSFYFALLLVIFGCIRVCEASELGAIKRNWVMGGEDVFSGQWIDLVRYRRRNANAIKIPADNDDY